MTTALMTSCRRPRTGAAARARRHAAHALALLPLLTGCAHDLTTPDDAALGDVPLTWSGVAATAVTGDPSLVGWWSRFHDPLLTKLVTNALHANPGVAGAQAALRQARALRDLAAAALWPTLNLSASAARTSSAQPPAGRATTDNFQAGLDANWELDIFGGNRSALNASDATARASAASLGDVQVSIAAEVALGYITLRNAQARLTIATENLASQRETLKITRWRQQAGLVTGLEAEQARTVVAQTSALLPVLQIAIAQASHALAVLTGRPPAVLAATLARAAPVPRVDQALALSLPADTLRQRADVRAAEQRVAAAQARVGEARAARLPNFQLGGSLGLNALTLGALTNGAAIVGTLLGGVSLPVFDGGAARANVNAQTAAFEQAQTDYRGAVLLALREVEDALVALSGDRLRLSRLADAASAAANAARLARLRYGSGLVDFQTVLDTQRTLLNTQDGVAIARADVSSDHVRLYKALGGGWEPVMLVSRAAPP